MKRRFAFCDPSGGSRETFPLAIAYINIFGKAALAGFWERKPPFSPDAVVEEYADILKGYGLTSVTGDKYAGAWVPDAFARHEISYQPSPLTKSEIFLTFLALVNSSKVRIPHDKRLRSQLSLLERKTTRGGRDHVDHPPGGFDDLANCAAGALVLAAAGSVSREPWATVISIYAGPASPGTYVSNKPEDLNDVFNDFGFGSSHGPSFSRPRR